jgi:hypothetical protein
MKFNKTLSPPDHCHPWQAMVLPPRKEYSDETNWIRPCAIADTGLQPARSHPAIHSPPALPNAHTAPLTNLRCRITDLHPTSPHFHPHRPPAPPTWTETPTITPTFTPSVPMVTPKDQPVNCRYGPGAVWLAVSALKLGASAEIVGRDDANAWWYIKDPLHPGAFCWVSMAVTNASGKLEGLPIIPPPEAQVIDASVSVNVGSRRSMSRTHFTCLQRLHHHQWACHGHLSLGNSRAIPRSPAAAKAMCSPKLIPGPSQAITCTFPAVPSG